MCRMFRDKEMKARTTVSRYVFYIKKYSRSCALPTCGVSNNINTPRLSEHAMQVVKRGTEQQAPQIQCGQAAAGEKIKAQDRSVWRGRRLQLAFVYV